MPNSLNLVLAESAKRNNETEKVSAELVSVEELEVMTLADINRAKQELSKRRQSMQFRVDDAKLKQTKKLLNIMDNTLDSMLSGYTSGEMTAKDASDLSRTYESLLKSLNMVSRLDSVDGGGRATKLSIEVKYKEE